MFNEKTKEENPIEKDVHSTHSLGDNEPEIAIEVPIFQVGDRVKILSAAQGNQGKRI